VCEAEIGVVDLTDCESRHTTTVHGVSIIKAYVYLQHMLLDTVCTVRDEFWAKIVPELNLTPFVLAVKQCRCLLLMY